MGWPQYVYLGLTFLGLGIVLARHGEPKEGEYSIWVSLITTGFILFLLYKGGFFS